MHRREILALLLIASLASGLLALPPAQWLNGLSIDVLTWLRWVTLGPRQDAAQSPVAVVVFDEDTRRRSALGTWSRVLLGRQPGAARHQLARGLGICPRACDGVFRRQAESPGLSRAELLRQSMLAVLESSERKNEAGEII